MVANVEGSITLSETEAFLDFWKSLCLGAIMPTSECFLDHTSARFAPSCYIVDISGDHAKVRFQGSQLIEYWQNDATGKDMHAGVYAKFKARAMSNLRLIAQQPCGMFSRFRFTTPGGDINSRYVNLPLAVQAGRPPRVVCFVIQDAVRQFDIETRAVEEAELRWIDIGAGVPVAPPVVYK